MPRSSAITSALINKLWADPALQALVPDGVFKNVARVSVATGGAPRKLVIVSLIVGEDVREFQRRSFESALYLVEARVLVTNNTDSANAAAQRIDEILDPQPPIPPATLTVAGYSLMTIEREEPVEGTEFDDADTSIQWSRVGGQYRVVMST